MPRVFAIMIGALFFIAGCSDGDDDTATGTEARGGDSPTVTGADPAPARVDEPDFDEVEEIDEPLYDPDVWFEVNAQGGSYLCTDSLRYRGFDCQRWYGGPVNGASVIRPDLYCSGSETFPECSESWYPDELAQYDFVSFGGRDLICERTRDPDYDWECGVYRGGNPDLVSTRGGVLCTGSYRPEECTR